jgi:hypothetical protein
VNQELQELVDGDMEKATFADWTAGGGATLSKEMNAAVDGSRVLRVRGASWCSASQGTLTPGDMYRVTGWVRGDGGTGRPVVGGLDTPWYGEAIADWQYFDITGVPISPFTLTLYQIGNGGNDYAEFDDIMITEYTPPIVNNEEGLLVDGDMVGTGAWGLQDGSSITGGKMVIDGTQTTVQTNFQAGIVDIGTQYKIEFEVSNYGAGFMLPRAGNTANGTTRTANGFYSEVIEAAGNETVYIVYSADFVGKIDNVFVTEYTPPMFNDNVQEVTDGDMELGGTVNWAPGNSATLTKPAGWVDDGSQVLRVAHGGADNPYALQSVADVDKIYRITGWVRSDETAIPKLYWGGATLIWTGVNTHANWQYFDEITTATSVALYLFNTLVVAGYSEWDDVFVTLTAPQYNYYGQLLVDGDMEVAAGVAVELFVDDDMELVGTVNWTPGASATLTKETADPHGGSQNLKIEMNGEANPNAYQTILEIGKEYRITGWARGDNTSDFIYPQVYHNGGSVWNGSRSSSWQAFDETFTAAATTILLQNKCSSAGKYGEFDDVSIMEVVGNGCDAWGAASAAVLSKESTDPQSGSLNMRITHGGENYPYAYQEPMVSGLEYRITGCARGDETSAPKVREDGGDIWVGGVSSSWQCFDETFTATGTRIRFYDNATVAGYTEFDSVVLTRTD